MSNDLGGRRTHLSDWTILPVAGGWALTNATTGAVVATYVTFRNATIRRRALMNDTSFARARGLPM